MTPDEFNTRLVELVEEAKQSFDPEWVFLGGLLCKATDETFMHGFNCGTFSNADAVWCAVNRVMNITYFKNAKAKGVME